MSRTKRMEFTAAQRSLCARLAAYRSWERTTDAAARTAPARRAAMARFERQVDPEGVLSPRRNGHGGVLRPSGRISRHWHCAVPEPARRPPWSSAPSPARGHPEGICQAGGRRGEGIAYRRGGAMFGTAGSHDAGRDGGYRVCSPGVVQRFAGLSFPLASR
jgi:hypothetical protein